MSLNALRSNQPDETPSIGSGYAIGENDAHVFNCPSCARPLTEGTSRCPACGTRLVLGVTVRRASSILSLGFALGLLAGGLVTAAVFTIALGDPALAGVGAGRGIVARPSPGGSAAPIAAPVRTVPSGAITALSGSAIVNARITVDRATLAAALKRKGTSTVDIARALRALAADAALGADLVPQIGRWPDAVVVMTKLDKFYGSMATTARDGLRASLTDNKAYRAAGTRMLKVLDSLPAVDAASRVLAATIGHELPPLVAPSGSGAP